MKRKILSMLLMLCMVLAFVPTTAFADEGTDSTPSVSTYATKDQLMGDTFAPNTDGTATNIGKLVFGKNSNGGAQEWYILGKDNGVTGDDNTVIFAASPIATEQVSKDNSNNKTYSTDWGCTYPSEITMDSSMSVYPNHYGASDFRAALKRMATDTNYFTAKEQTLMNYTTVATADTKNGNVSYTTTDKLYALAADAPDVSFIKAGANNDKILLINMYCGDIDYNGIGLRSPGNQTYYLLYVNFQKKVWKKDVFWEIGVCPASNLNLSSVLFASAAKASSSGTITDGTAMTLRLDGSDKNIGSVAYDPTKGVIKAVKGSITGDAALVVQGNDGISDWYYSKKISGTEIVNVSDIVAESNTPASLSLSACKIWLETTEDNVAYAVNATKTTISSISSVEITGIDVPAPNTALDTEAACATTGVSNTTPLVTWTPNDSTAGCNTSYTASVTLTADTSYVFTDSTTATVNGKTASVKKNDDGTLTVTYAFTPTTKDKIQRIIPPDSITVENGTAYEDMNLPETVEVETAFNSVTSLPVKWYTETPKEGSYDPSIKTEQTVALYGFLQLPDTIEADLDGPETTTITITIKAAPGTSDDSNKDNDSNKDKDSKTDAEDSVKTGDNTNLGLWLTLMLLSGGLLTVTGIYEKKKKYSR